MHRRLPSSRLFRPFSIQNLPPSSRATTRDALSIKLAPSTDPAWNSYSRGYSTHGYIPVQQKREPNPLLQALLLITAFGVTSLMGLKLWDKYNEKPRVFPAEVEEKLRQAIWHSEIESKPDQSLDEFNEALKTAESIEMDPLSDEYLGIIIRKAQMLEKYGRIEEALEVQTNLAMTLFKCFAEDMANIGVISRKTYTSLTSPINSIPSADGQQDAVQNSAANLQSSLQAMGTEINEFIASGRKPNLSKDIPSQHQTRIRLYTKWFGTINNIGLLCTSLSYFMPAINAFNSILFYNDLLVRKLKLFPSDDQALLSLVQQASIHNNMAHAASSSGESYIAAFQNWNAALNIFRALNGQSPTCEEVTLLSNLGLARAQISQQYGTDLAKLKQEKTPAVDFAAERSTALNAGSDIIKTSLKVASRITPPTRTGECDMGCLTAAMNLAVFTEELGDLKGSKKWLEQAKSLAQTLLLNEEKEREAAEHVQESGYRGLIETLVGRLRGGIMPASALAAASAAADEQPSPTATMVGGAPGAGLGEVTLMELIQSCEKRIAELDKKIG